MSRRIAVVGRGNVGGTLGRRWAERGHAVVYAVREPSAPDEAALAAAVAGAEVVVLAVPGSAVGPELAGDADWTGKIVIDATNPIAADFSGLLPPPEGSNAERAAAVLPGARVVKAFNTIGFDGMADPDFGGTPATMLVAGDDENAVAAVRELAADLGFAPETAGPLAMARYLEAFAWVWIAMAMKYGHGRGIAFTLHRR